ncbi:MAG TPA: NusG domain II-containing protein [Thioalkalivibrio sp.]|nr:NusG domain II-containing protein [Thioalkalivibrio sp.]
MTRAPGTLGDGLVILCAVVLVGISYQQFWTGAPDGPASELRIVAAGDEFARLPLDQPRSLDVPGPAGITRVEVADGAARCAESPGTQGICQRAGWLRQPGDMAVSLPNRVLIEVLGEADRHFDSINY